MSNATPVQIRKTLSIATLADLAVVDCSALQTGCIAFVVDQAASPFYMYHATSSAVVSSPTIIDTPNGATGRWFRMNPPAYG